MIIYWSQRKKWTGEKRENCIIELTTTNLSQGYAYSILLQQFYKQAIQTTFYCTQNLFSLASIFTQTRVHNPISALPWMRGHPQSNQLKQATQPEKPSPPCYPTPIPLTSKNSKVVTKKMMLCSHYIIVCDYNGINEGKQFSLWLSLSLCFCGVQYCALFRR